MKKLYVEVADTPLKREWGLMDRKALGKNQGMLFKFPYHTRLSFWMKSTYVPLDIAFLDDDGRILQIEEMIPLSTRAISSFNNCRYALEVNKGWFKENGLSVGSKVRGMGVGESIRLAQQIPAPVTIDQVPPAEANPPVGNVEDMLEQPAQPLPPVPNPDVALNMSFRQILEDANIRDKQLIMIYTKKDGFTLPPKVISPPFLFGPTAEGQANGLVTCWDDQEAAWKSFIIDNIVDLEPKEEENQQT